MAITKTDIYRHKDQDNAYIQSRLANTNAPLTLLIFLLLSVPIISSLLSQQLQLNPGQRPLRLAIGERLDVEVVRCELEEPLRPHLGDGPQVWARCERELVEKDPFRRGFEAAGGMESHNLRTGVRASKCDCVSGSECLPGDP